MGKKREVECFFPNRAIMMMVTTIRWGAKRRREKTRGRKTQTLGERNRESGRDCELREMVARKSRDKQTLVW